MTVRRRQTWLSFHVPPCLKWTLRVTLDPVDAQSNTGTGKGALLPEHLYSFITSWAAGALQTSVTP